MSDADPDGETVSTFAAQRDRLVGVAYRVLGSWSEAEDVVQEVWLRWSRAQPGSIQSPSSWLTTVTTRVALDQLRSARWRREQYVGPWLPELVEGTAGEDPEAQAELAESVTVGFLAVMERLQPIERVVFLLADVFGMPFAEIAEAVGKRPEACRQIASRARRRVRDERPPFAPTSTETWATADRFVAALAAGDVDAMVMLLDPGAVLVSDGGPHHRAARRPIAGAVRIGRVLARQQGLARDWQIERRLVNAQPAFVVRAGGALVAVVVLAIAEGRVQRVYLVVNPDKLSAFSR